MTATSSETAGLTLLTMRFQVTFPYSYSHVSDRPNCTAAGCISNALSNFNAVNFLAPNVLIYGFITLPSVGIFGSITITEPISKVYLIMTAGWSSGLWLRLRNQRSRVQVLVVARAFVMNNYTCSRVMAVYIYYYQYNLYMFIRYLVSVTQVRKDT
jgi:hypothetical protein